jgi:hypothetical protein
LANKRKKLSENEFPLLCFTGSHYYTGSNFLWIPLWKRIDKKTRVAALFTFLLLCILSAGFQYLCLVRVNAWYVHPENTWLLPIAILHSPLEEYLFWWGFALIMLAAYLWPVQFNKEEKEENI